MNVINIAEKRKGLGILGKENLVDLAKYNIGVREQPVRKFNNYTELFKKSKQIKVIDNYDNSENTVMVNKNKAIRIFGYYNEKSFDLVFLINDKAIYDSYNLKYIGKIVSITEKTVTIKNSSGEKTRLKHHLFIRKNYNFHLGEVMKYNSYESHYI